MREILKLCQELGQMLGQATADIWELIRRWAIYTAVAIGVVLIIITLPVWLPLWFISYLDL